MEEAVKKAVDHPDGAPAYKVKETNACLVCTSESAVTPNFDANVPRPTWTDFYEPRDKPTFEEARGLVLEGKSVFTQGFGSTGRTCSAKQLARELLEKKTLVRHTNYTRMANQNIAAPRAICGTLHHCLQGPPASVAWQL